MSTILFTSSPSFLYISFLFSLSSFYLYIFFVIFLFICLFRDGRAALFNFQQLASASSISVTPINIGDNVNMVILYSFIHSFIIYSFVHSTITDILLQTMKRGVSGVVLNVPNPSSQSTAAKLIKYKWRINTCSLIILCRNLGLFGATYLCIQLFYCNHKISGITSNFALFEKRFFYFFFLALIIILEYI